MQSNGASVRVVVLRNGVVVVRLVVVVLVVDVPVVDVVVDVMDVNVLVVVRNGDVVVAVVVLVPVVVVVGIRATTTASTVGNRIARPATMGKPADTLAMRVARRIPTVVGLRYTSIIKNDVLPFPGASVALVISPLRSPPTYAARITSLIRRFSSARDSVRTTASVNVNRSTEVSPTALGSGVMVVDVVVVAVVDVVGARVGALVGERVGERVGVGVVGERVGSRVGEKLGALVGRAVVGLRVGTCPSPTLPAAMVGVKSRRGIPGTAMSIPSIQSTTLRAMASDTPASRNSVMFTGAGGDTCAPTVRPTTLPSGSPPMSTTTRATSLASSDSAEGDSAGDMSLAENVKMMMGTSVTSVVVEVAVTVVAVVVVVGASVGGGIVGGAGVGASLNLAPPPHAQHACVASNPPVPV